MSEEIKALYLNSATLNSVVNKHENGDYIKMLEAAVILLKKEVDDLKYEKLISAEKTVLNRINKAIN